MTNKQISTYPDLIVSSSTVEVKIRPLVDVLNSVGGVKTVASCGGHYRRNPFVGFTSDLLFASRVSGVLIENHIPWSVEVGNRGEWGSFNTIPKPVFWLRPNKRKWNKASKEIMRISNLIASATN